MHYGIIVNISPLVNMQNQGLTRLLIQLVCNSSKHQKFDIILPDYSLREFRKLLSDYSINYSYLSIKTIKSPYILRFLKFWSGYKRSKLILKQYNFYRASKPNSLSKNGLLHLTVFLKALFYFIHVAVEKFVRKILSDYYHKLILLANSKSEASAWLLPFPVFPEAVGLNKPFALVIPDLVYVDFPFAYATPLFCRNDQSIKTLAQKAIRIITYSNYVKYEHVHNYLQIPIDKITTIHNAGIDSLKYLSNANEIFDADLHSIKNSAKYKINTYLLRNYPRDYAKHLIKQLDTHHFIIASMQFRPHKNILNLLRVLKILNSQLDNPILLVLTADLFSNSSVKLAIDTYGLQDYIISLFDLPNEILASMNCLASISIFPTLSEGGFPYFSFYEAYSVGTPCLLSITPVSKEIHFSKEITNRTFFDPLKIYEIVDKLHWAITNRSKLFSMQKEIYSKLKERSWLDVAADYINALNDTVLK